MKILVIDDDCSLNRLVKARLSSIDGHTVLLADNGEAGLQLAVQESPKLILLDWLMPELNGIEVLQRLKASPATKSITVMMMTAKNKVGEMEEALALGAKDYITKPFTLDRLGEKIDALIG